jgi:PAS domain-containing protein
MADFFSILQNSEKRLLASIRKRAKGQDRYLAAVEEIWNRSFQGLTGTFMKAAETGSLREPEGGRWDPADPVVAFGREEARRHRERGVSLEMFLGLLELYRPSYLELVHETIQDGPERDEAVREITKFFDRLETAFCLAWVHEAEAGNLQELHDRNLELVTERDRYLAVFESIPTPVLLLNPDLSVRNLNHAAHQLFLGWGAPGAWYFGTRPEPETPFLTAVFPDFFQELQSFQESQVERAELDWAADVEGMVRHFRVVLSRMLDQPSAFAGILVTLDDQTERIQATNERERVLGELQSLLAEVRKLSNLLPICAWCKKIRNDQGYWDQLEGYLATNAGIVFSHGVCPECAAKVRTEGGSKAQQQD